MNPKRDPVAHAILLLGALLFIAPLWLVFVGSTQDGAAIARGDLSLLPGHEGFAAYRRVLNGPVPPLVSVTSTVKLKKPPAFGVPLMVPVTLLVPPPAIVKPVGNPVATQLV